MHGLLIRYDVYTLIKVFYIHIYDLLQRQNALVN